ncbi:MAG: beta galactosidase jelly roll domain-containing protein [Deltaproteobacteria bacterium]|nr:beta galactosidase jelly roll domain-containing protein [Deltaproteobacteria bacterium]
MTAVGAALLLSACAKTSVVTTVRPAIDTSFPVMPNSIFAGLASAQHVSPGSVRADAAGSYVSEDVSGTIMLDGSYAFTTDAVGIGETQKVPFFAPRYDDSSWLTVTVPDNYQVDVPGLEKYYGAVWYRDHFTLTDAQAKAHNALVLKGVDYFAKVWLNGTLLGEHEGYFDPIMFDVTGIAKTGDNVLAVKVINPSDPSFGIAESNAGDTQMAEKVWIKGILDYHDTRPGDSLLPDDVQSMGTGGIYRPVSIKSYRDVRWDWVFITPELSSDYSKADVFIDYFLTDADSLPLPVSVATYVDLPGTVYRNTFTIDVQLKPGENHFTAKFTIDKPALWWLYDHPEAGSPALYRASFSVSYNGVLEDVRDDTFGVRAFKQVTADDGSTYFELNGRRIFLRGTNYIPTEWMSHITDGTYLADYTLMKDAGMDAFVIHDHIEPQALLSTADQQGIGVFYNFSLIWEYSICDFERPDGDPALTNNLEVIKRMLPSALYLEYNHPSLLFWTLHDEPFYSFFPVSSTEDDCPASPVPLGSAPSGTFLDKSFNRVIDDALYSIATAIVKNIPVHESGNRGDDSTTYYGWYTGNSFDIDSNPIPFPIEFGAEAIPYAIGPVMEQELGAEWWPADVTTSTIYAWQYHDLQIPVQSLYIGKPSSYPDFDSWAAASQLYQAAVSKYLIEDTRIHKYAPTYSEFQFMLNDWWPSMAWGIVDWNRTPLTAYDWVSMVDQPVMVAVQHGYNVYRCGTTVTLPVFVVNDLFDPLRLALSYRLDRQTDSTYITGDATGLDDGIISPLTKGQLENSMPVLTTVTIGSQATVATVASGTMDVTVPADSSTNVTTTTVPLPPCTADLHYTLSMALNDDSGNEVAHNWYHFIARPSP